MDPVIRKGKQAAKQRACSIACYSADKLAGWQQNSEEEPKASDTGRGETHRLRLLNKKLTYSIEFFEDLFPDKRFSSNRLR